MMQTVIFYPIVNGALQQKTIIVCGVLAILRTVAFRKRLKVCYYYIEFIGNSAICYRVERIQVENESLLLMLMN